MKYQFVRPFAWSVIALLVLTATAWGETLTEIPTSAAADVEFRGISPDDFTAIFFNQRQLGGTFFEQPYTSPIDFYLECWDETYPYKSCKLVPDLEDGTDYSIFWEGWLYVPESGKYTFFFENVDDGAMLLLDEDRIVEMGWFYPDPDTKPSPQEVWLDARWYRLKVFYEQRIHYVASFSLRWSGPGFEEEVIPVMPAGIRPDAISPTDCPNTKLSLDAAGENIRPRCAPCPSGTKFPVQPHTSSRYFMPATTKIWKRIAENWRRR